MVSDRGDREREKEKKMREEEERADEEWNESLGSGVAPAQILC